MNLQNCSKMTLGIFSTTLGFNFQHRKSTRGVQYSTLKNEPRVNFKPVQILRYTGKGLQNVDYARRSGT
jgi:hypothetical protein